MPLAFDIKAQYQQGLQDGIIAGEDHGVTKVLDMVILVLGEDYEMPPEKVAEIFHAIERKWMAWAEEAAEDKEDNGDDSRAVYKSKLDRAIRQCVPEREFCPYKDRYRFDLYGNDFIPERIKRLTG